MVMRHGQLHDPVSVARLHKRIFGEASISIDTASWFANSPDGPSRWYAAFNGSEPIGLYGLLPMVVCSKGRLRRAALCHNVGVVPEWRGRGVFTSLGEYALRHMGMELAIGVPNEQATPGHMKVGWRKAGKLVLMRGRGRATAQMFDTVNENSAKFGDWRCSPRAGWGFHVVRGLGWAQWRYSKPEQQYFQGVVSNGLHRTVWKVRDEFSQVMETTTLSVALTCGDTVDMPVFEGSEDYEMLERWGFEQVFWRDFILYGDDAEEGVDISWFQFELCDFDVF